MYLTDNQTFILLLCPRPKIRVGWHKVMLRSVRPSVRPSVCLSVCLSRFPILSSSLDGDMRASPFHTHSIGDSTVVYACVRMLSVGGISLRLAIPCSYTKSSSQMFKVLLHMIFTLSQKKISTFWLTASTIIHFGDYSRVKFWEKLTSCDYIMCLYQKLTSIAYMFTHLTCKR